MYKLITALNNKYINEKLKKLNKYEIKYTDISYQDGIFEILEKENFDYLLLAENLKGKYNIEDLILKIKTIDQNIEIIIILKSKNKKLEEFLLKNNIKNYFYNNEITCEEFCEINFIKNKIINNNINDIKNIILKNNKKIRGKYFKRNTLILSLCGKNSLEKIKLCKYIISNNINKKILIINFDVLDDSLVTSFGVDKKSNINNNDNLNSFLDVIKKINKNVDIFFNNNFIINSDIKYIYEEINKLKNNYDYILINLSPIYKMNLSKKIIENSNYSIFVFGKSKSEYRFNQNLLNLYINNWNINKEKVICLFNKIKNSK